MAVATAEKKGSPRTTRALSDLETHAREVAQLTRALIDTHGIDVDPARPNELAVALGDLGEQLRDLLANPAGLARDPVRAAEMCELMAEVTELQQDLREYVIGLRFSALARIHGSLGRLRGLGTIAELLKETPEELCHCCDFDRAVISRVRGSTWVPEFVCIGVREDRDVAEQTIEYLKTIEIPLSPMLLETELARRRAPVLVSDAVKDPRTYKELVTVSRTKSYVAAPIVSSGRVIGLLHADCYDSRRELTGLDRDNLWTFAEGFGLVFERIVLVERLAAQRERAREAFKSASDIIDGLCDSEVKLARQGREDGAVAATAANMFMPGGEPRVHSLMTAREREVLALMVEGARNNQIADQLVISEGTVKSHVKNICRKLRASNRAEAVSKYLQLVMRENR